MNNLDRRLQRLEQRAGDPEPTGPDVEAIRARVMERWRRLTPEEQVERIRRVTRGEIPSLSSPETIQQARRLLGWPEQAS